MKEWIKEGFDYDFWANTQWLEAVTELEHSRVQHDSAWLRADSPLTEKCLAVMAHIRDANTTWLFRAGHAISLPEFTLKTAEACFAHIHDEWIVTLGCEDLEKRMEYRDSKGHHQVRPLRDIMRHVVNHGSYHRGQLRQIFIDLGNLTHPNTDWVEFRDAIK